MGRGEGGVGGRFLSADIALFGTDRDDVVAVLEFGEGHRLGPEAADGVDDLYLELISLVLDRLVVSFFLWVSSAECFNDA